MATKAVNTAIAVADAATWYLVLTLVAIVLLSSLRCDSALDVDLEPTARGRRPSTSTGRPCEEIYVVGEGETLHTISDKCGDPFILDRNPHIHDPDDVFPGLVIQITK